MEGPHDLCQRLREATSEGSFLLSQNRFSEAFNRYKNLVHEIKGRLPATRSEQEQVPNRVGSFVSFFPLPGSGEWLAPSYEDEIFHLPFTLLVDPVPLTGARKKGIRLQQRSVEIHAEDDAYTHAATACSATALFNMGLSTQLGVIRGFWNSDGKTLKVARNCYQGAWSCVRLLIPEINDKTPSGTFFLLMAICTNLSMCFYHLGELDEYNKWQFYLNELLSCSTGSDGSDDPAQKELRNYFLLTAALNPKCIAAPEA